MMDIHPKRTPLPAKTILTAETDEALLLNSEKATRYRPIVGALMYLFIATRIEISFAWSRLSRFSAHPGKKHLEAAHLAYLRGTLNYGIFYRYKPPSPHYGIQCDFTSFSDSAFADPENRRSTAALLFALNGAAIS